MIMVKGNKLIKEKEASTKYGLSVRWFQHNRYSENKIPYYKLNNHIFYNATDIDSWLDENLKPNY